MALALCCTTPNSAAHKARLEAEIAHREWAQYQQQVAAEEAEHKRWLDAMVKESQCASAVATTAFPLIGAVCAAAFLWTFSDYPLVPLQLENAAWGSNWLLATVGAYYAAAACLVGVILSSENLCVGAVWSLALLLLGAPFGCIYLVVRVCHHGTLGLMSLKDGLFMTPAYTDTGAVTGYASGFYVVAGGSFFLRLVWTIRNYPLFPLQTEDPVWACEWLFTTVGDLYTCLFCLCGVIVSTESTLVGLMWCAALMVFGGPGACIYMAYRAFVHQSISLQAKSTDWW